MDSDDRWLPYKLSLQFKVLGHFPGINIIHSNFYTFDGDRIIIPRGLDYWVMSFREENAVDWSLAYSRKYRSSDFNIQLDRMDFDIYAGNIFAALLYASYGACWTMLIHRSCLGNDIRFAEHTYEDYWFLCKLAEHNEIVFLDVPTAENRGHGGERITSREYLIDPLKCHLAICQSIFMGSKSPFKPDNAVIDDKCKDLRLRLMKEYMKKGDLEGAKNIRALLDKTAGFRGGMTNSLYRLLTYLPFNIVSHLVRAKRNIAGR